MEDLLSLYYEVALLLVKKKMRRYWPMHLIIDYINQAHPTITNHKMFNDVGTILSLIIKDEKHTHVQDVSFILKHFLGLKEKILKSAIIPKNIINTIDFYIFNLFDGNLSHYELDKTLLERIFEFYENLEVQIDKDQRKMVIYTKYRQFFDEKLSDINMDLNLIQSTYSYKRFTEFMLEITQKYCLTPEKQTLIATLTNKIEELHRNSCVAIQNAPEIRSSVEITDTQIQAVLKQFENDALQEFLLKVINSEYFLPKIPEHLDLNRSSGVTCFIPTIIYDDNISRNFPAGHPFENDNYYKFTAMEHLLYFEMKLEEYKSHEVLGGIYAFIHMSPLIDLITRKLFQTCLVHYHQGDYFHCIQCVVFQIEHILRKFSERSEIPHLFHNKKKTIPKGLDYLIPKLKEKQVLSAKLLYFIEWFLCGSEDRITENIRNKIAHGITSIDQFRNIYTKKNALALILIFLCLSKYDFDS